MAETRARNSNITASRDGPVLRPGRPADPGQSEPVPPARQPADDADDATAEASGNYLPTPSAAPADDATSGDHDVHDVDTEGAEASAESDEVQRLYAESNQRRLRRLLRQCERVNLLDFNVLSLAGWPDNYTLNAARRRRDSWMLSAIIVALVFLSGMSGFVPAWIAGGGFGAFVVILLMGVPVIRRLYSSKSSYLDLILYRQQLLRDARKHIAHLEGEVGLIWQCNELAEFNPSLALPRFSTLRHLSEQRRLTGSLSRREHIRLYLIFMLEAEKAYERLQTAYFKAHQEAIDRGWKSVAETVTESPEKALRNATKAQQAAGHSGEPEPEGSGAEPGSDTAANA